LVSSCYLPIEEEAHHLFHPILLDPCEDVPCEEAVLLGNHLHEVVLSSVEIAAADESLGANADDSNSNQNGLYHHHIFLCHYDDLSVKVVLADCLYLSSIARHQDGALGAYLFSAAHLLGPYFDHVVA